MPPQRESSGSNTSTLKNLPRGSENYPTPRASGATPRGSVTTTAQHLSGEWNSERASRQLSVYEPLGDTSIWDVHEPLDSIGEGPEASIPVSSSLQAVNEAAEGNLLTGGMKTHRRRGSESSDGSSASSSFREHFSSSSSGSDRDGLTGGNNSASQLNSSLLSVVCDH